MKGLDVADYESGSFDYVSETLAWCSCWSSSDTKARRLNKARSSIDLGHSKTPALARTDVLQPSKESV